MEKNITFRGREREIDGRRRWRRRQFIQGEESANLVFREKKKVHLGQIKRHSRVHIDYSCICIHIHYSCNLTRVTSPHVVFQSFYNTLIPKGLPPPNAVTATPAKTGPFKEKSKRHDKDVL